MRKALCHAYEKNLNDLLSNRKEVVAKKGIGFAPKSKNKKKNDKTKRPPPLKQTFVKEGEGASKEKKNNAKGGGVKKGNATPSNKAGNFNPSYVLSVLVMGMFMLNLLVLLMSTSNGLFGFLRPLLLTSKDPLQNGYLKPSIDLL